MFTSYHQKRKRFLLNKIAQFLVIILSFSLIFGPSAGYAQVVMPQTILNLPLPGAMVSMSPGFTPTLVKGITIHPENPLEFDFLVDTGDENLDENELKVQSNKLIKYFLAALTVPEDEMWVNLSPYEKDRMIPGGFGKTQMGRDLLAQDYILKQLTASLMYPEDALGQEFWKRVYKRAQEEYGTSEIPMNTFNKVWIVPQKAVVYEHEQTAYVVESHLKVMLEEDYLALAKNSGQSSVLSGQKNNLMADSSILNSELSIEQQTLSTEIIREIIVPEIEKEVNEGKSFAQLRQIYNSVILATWYKMNLKNSLLGQVYVDQNKVKGIDLRDTGVNQKIYNQYLEAFKTGVYNYIREDIDPQTEEIIPRKYFSGGTRMSASPILTVVTDGKSRLVANGVSKKTSYSVNVNMLEVEKDSDLSSILEFQESANDDLYFQMEKEDVTAASPVEETLMDGTKVVVTKKESDAIERLLIKIEKENPEFLATLYLLTSMEGKFSSLSQKEKDMLWEYGLLEYSHKWDSSSLTFKLVKNSLRSAYVLGKTSILGDAWRSLFLKGRGVYVIDDPYLYQRPDERRKKVSEKTRGILKKKIVSKLYKDINSISDAMSDIYPEKTMMLDSIRRGLGLSATLKEFREYLKKVQDILNEYEQSEAANQSMVIQINNMIILLQESFESSEKNVDQLVSIRADELYRLKYKGFDQFRDNIIIHRYGKFKKGKLQKPEDSKIYKVTDFLLTEFRLEAPIMALEVIALGSNEWEKIPAEDIERIEFSSSPIMGGLFSQEFNGDITEEVRAKLENDKYTVKQMWRIFRNSKKKIDHLTKKFQNSMEGILGLKEDIRSRNENHKIVKEALIRQVGLEAVDKASSSPVGDDSLVDRAVILERLAYALIGVDLEDALKLENQEIKKWTINDFKLYVRMILDELDSGGLSLVEGYQVGRVERGLEGLLEDLVAANREGQSKMSSASSAGETLGDGLEEKQKERRQEVEDALLVIDERVRKLGIEVAEAFFGSSNRVEHFGKWLQYSGPSSAFFQANARQALSNGVWFNANFDFQNQLVRVIELLGKVDENKRSDAVQKIIRSVETKYKELISSSPIRDDQLANETVRMTQDAKYGGIDLNPAHLDLQIKRDGKGIPLPLFQQPIETFNIEGFVPVIINVTPITNLPLLLGLIDEGSQEDDSELSFNLSKADIKMRPISPMRKEQFLS